MHRLATIAAACLLAAATASAQTAGQEKPREGWHAGPHVGQLGSRATIAIPDGYVFLDAGATKAFLEATQNIPDGDELGIILRERPDKNYWFAVFSYSDSGHVDDGERNSLDANAILKSLQEGNRAGNEERRQRGWSTLDLEGWHQSPFYDAATNNLTWATKLTSDGERVINHSVRLLGRTGLMSAQLVDGSDTIDAATTEFNAVLKTYAYSDGQRYAQFMPGDRVAAYGLSALIAGGAGAVAVKSGLFQKLWKLIVFGAVAVLAALKKLIGGLFGKRDAEEPQQQQQA
jgi:uncharacterized membrane-anchored protein